MSKKISKKSQKNKNIADKIIAAIASNKFFWFIISLFVLQAGWLAVSAAYPLIFDELYHPGLIDFFSNQFSPIVGSQSIDTVAEFGDLTRANSTLYHYLLSFPYRVVIYFTDSFYVAIISMRLINVAFVASGLYFFRKLFDEMKINRSVSHTAFFFLTLVPIFVYVPANINYDNLIFLLLPIFLIYGLRIYDNSSNNLSSNLLKFLLIGVFASLVKFSFLPIFFTSVAFATFSLVKKYRSRLPSKITSSLRKNSKVSLVILVVPLILLSIYFVERYSVNVIRYGNTSVSCDEIHPLEACLQQPLFKRSYSAQLDQDINPKKIENFVEYMRLIWIPQVVSDFANTAVWVAADSEPPKQLLTSDTSSIAVARGQAIPILSMVFWVGLVVSIILISNSWRKLKKIRGFLYINIVFIAYSFSLIVLTNYASYQDTGVAYGVQSRYFIIFLPIIFVYTVISANYAINNRWLKVTVLAITLLLFTQGGGITTYIVRSNEGWYWQKDIIVDTNMQAQEILKPLIKEN